MISLNRVKRSYRNRSILVQEEPITIQKGVTCIIRLNGVGKTTLLKILTGIIEPEEGMIQYNSSSIADSLKDIGIMFDQGFFYPDLTGIENLTYFNAFQEKPIDQNDLERIAKEWAIPLDDTKVKDYSFGMKKRLTIAFSRLSNPNYWFLDEPFNGIDSEGKEQLIHKIKSEREKNKTILLISHDINRNIHLADHVLIVHNRSMYYIEEFSSYADQLIISSAFVSSKSGYDLPDELTSNLISFVETNSGYEIHYLKEKETEIIEWFLEEKMTLKNVEDKLVPIEQLIQSIKELS